MAGHEKFNFKTLDALRTKIAELGVDIPVQEDLSPLKRPVQVGPFVTPNSLGIHPMEGADGDADGTPSALTVRRYERFAAGGAGILWFEATAVVPQGRANPRHLWIHKENVGTFADLVNRTKAIAVREFGEAGMPMMILQLTHAGRHSRPVDKPAPVIAARNPYLDPKHNLPADYPIISDEELEALEDDYVAAAKLAVEAGFRAVDIKAVHNYLCSELLSAHTRPGRYGGSFENRTRFILNIIDKVKSAVPELTVCARLNACDQMPYPYAWGMDKEVPGKVDLSEPIQLVRLMAQRGVKLVNISAGSPYYNAFVGRPFDQPTRGAAVPEEHPLEGVARLIGVARHIQLAVPEMVIMGAGYSWLRQFFPYVAAATLAMGWVKIAGLGREAFAYPDFARDILEKGIMDTRKTCTACSKCTQLMRDDSVTGCVTRDAEVYMPFYREHCLSREK
jgi:2,4-dienoyl-CoA reductase (NADPH2)